MPALVRLPVWPPWLPAGSPSFAMPGGRRRGRRSISTGAGCAARAARSRTSWTARAAGRTGSALSSSGLCQGVKWREGGARGRGLANDAR